MLMDPLPCPVPTVTVPETVTFGEPEAAKASVPLLPLEVEPPSVMLAQTPADTSTVSIAELETVIESEAFGWPPVPEPPVMALQFLDVVTDNEVALPVAVPRRAVTKVSSDSFRNVL